MPEGNGNGNRIEKEDKLKGWLRDKIIKFGKDLPNVWEKMSGTQQEQQAYNASCIAETLIDDVFEIVVARGCTFIEGEIGKFSGERGKGVAVKLVLPFNDEVLGELSAVAGHPVICITRETAHWKGADRFEPDNVAVKGEDGQTSMILPRGNAAAIAEAMAVHSGPAEAQMAMQAEGMAEPDLTIPADLDRREVPEQPLAEQVAATS